MSSKLMDNKYPAMQTLKREIQEEGNIPKIKMRETYQSQETCIEKKVTAQGS